MSAQLIRYDAARQALAEAHRVDEVKDIRDKAMALKLYARQSKDRQLIEHATEIRARAERRLGELMERQRDTVGMAKGARGNPAGRGAKIVRDSEKPAQPTLSDAGIDKNLAHRARKAARMSEGEFEAEIDRRKRRASAVLSGDPIEEACTDCRDTEERWQRSLGNLAGQAIALRAYWSREFGKWQKFEVPGSLAQLAKQAAQAWNELASELAQRAEL
jgi:hypothetical protein